MTRLRLYDFGMHWSPTHSSATHSSPMHPSSIYDSAVFALCLIAVLVLSIAIWTPQVYAATTTFHVVRSGDELIVSADADLDADLDTTWRVLTTYDQLAEFVPGLHHSRTLERNGSHAVIEQIGSAGFGPFRQRFALTLSVREVPHQQVQAQGVGGDFLHFASSYALSPRADGRTRLAYRATLKPTAGIPALVGVPVMRSAIRAQFDALLAEIERAARRGETAQAE